MFAHALAVRATRVSRTRASVKICFPRTQTHALSRAPPTNRRLTNRRKTRKYKHGTRALRLFRVDCGMRWKFMCSRHEQQITWASVCVCFCTRIRYTQDHGHTQRPMPLPTPMPAVMSTSAVIIPAIIHSRHRLATVKRIAPANEV